MEKFENEKRVVAAVQGWLDRNWRTGAAWNYRTKAALCGSLTAALHGMRTDGPVGRCAAAALADLEDIRHTKARCTARFTDRLTRFVSDLNAALRALSEAPSGDDAPQVTIPVRGAYTCAPARQTVSVPAEFADRERTLVPLNSTPVEIAGGNLGTTRVVVTVLSGKVTVSVEQDRK